MGTATCGGKGFVERTRVSGERPIGAASRRQHSAWVSCQPTTPPPLPRCLRPCENPPGTWWSPSTNGRSMPQRAKIFLGTVGTCVGTLGSENASVCPRAARHSPPSPSAALATRYRTHTPLRCWSAHVTSTPCRWCLVVSLCSAPGR